MSEGRHEWRTPEIRDLLEATLRLESADEAERFFRELEAMAHRWHAARLVDEGLPYHEVAKRSGASTATVTRVAHWLRYGEGGYRLVLDRLGSPAPTG